MLLPAGSPDGVAFLAAVKATDRAIRVAGEQKNDPMVHVLEAARTPVAECLVAIRIRLVDRKAGSCEGRASAGARGPCQGGRIPRATVIVN